MRRLLIAVPLLLVGTSLDASAQIARGSYRQSCNSIQQDGSRLSAICKGQGGQPYRTSIDLGQCGEQPVSNSFGRLTCGGVQGSASPVRSGGYGDDDQGGGYDRPRPRYRQPDDGGDYGYRPLPPAQPRYGYGDDYPPPPPPRRRYAPPPGYGDDD